MSIVLDNMKACGVYLGGQALSPTDIDSGYSTGAVVGGSGTMTDGGNLTATAAYSYSAPAQLTVQIAVSGSGYDPRPRVPVYC